MYFSSFLFIVFSDYCHRCCSVQLSPAGHYIVILIVCLMFVELGFSLLALNNRVYPCVSGSLETSSCRYRSIFNVTTQKPEGSCVIGRVECFVYGKGSCLWYHGTASLAYVCAKVVSATETHVLQTGCDWQPGQRAFGSFLIFFLTRGVPWDLEFMLQYISRAAYGCNEDGKQTEH